MLRTASKYANVHRAADAPRQAAPSQRHHPRPGLNLLIPKVGALVKQSRVFWEELRRGEWFKRYVKADKHHCQQRWNHTARNLRNFDPRPNHQSDLELKAMVPARDFFRWQQTDPNFWDDDKNLRKLKRDNEAARNCIFNV
jgi:hypothetical protein